MHISPTTKPKKKPSHVDDTADYASQTMRRNPCGKVNKLQIIIQARTKPPPKGGFVHEVLSTNTKNTNKKPQQEISLRLYYAELLTKIVKM